MSPHGPDRAHRRTRNLARPPEPVHPQTTPTEASDDSTPTTQRRLKLHTPTEAADILAVRESWLRRKASQRLVPCTFVGKHLRFSDSNLAAITEAGQQPIHPRARRGRSM